jgi:hypothetical protein
VNMPILAAAQQALRRSLIDQPIPIVVEEHNGCHSLLDVHELNIAHWQLRGIEVQTRYERTQVQMIRNERMANLGRLVDGVAHEILDPVGFIWGNLSHINDYTQQLLEVLAAYQAQVGHLPPGSELSEDLSDVDELAYIQADLPKAIASVKGGAQRLKTLAASLQNFCHIDDVYPKPADLHETLDSLVLLINSRLNGEIQFTREYGHLPPVICYAGQLSQAMMTLLLKLVDELLGDAVRRAVTNDLAIASMSPVIPTNTTPPEITLTTQVVSDVHLSPNGWITPRHDLFDWKQSGVETTPDPASKRWVSIQFSRNGDRWSALHQQQLLNAVYGDRWETHPAGFSTSYRVITVQHSGQLRWRSPTLPNANDPKFGAAFEILMPLI